MDISTLPEYMCLHSHLLDTPHEIDQVSRYISMTPKRLTNELDARNMYQRLCFDQIGSPKEMLAAIDALRSFIDANSSQPQLINFHYPPESDTAILERLEEREKTAHLRAAIKEAKRIYESLTPDDPALCGKIRRLRKLLASVDCPLRHISEVDKSDEQIDAELGAMESASSQSRGWDR